MAELAGPARQEGDERHDQLRSDGVQEPRLLEVFRVLHRLRDYPRVAEGERGIREDPVRRPAPVTTAAWPEKSITLGIPSIRVQGLADRTLRRNRNLVNSSRTAIRAKSTPVASSRSLQRPAPAARKPVS